MVWVVWDDVGWIIDERSCRGAKLRDNTCLILIPKNLQDAQAMKSARSRLMYSPTSVDIALNPPRYLEFPPLHNYAVHIHVCNQPADL